MYLRNYEDAVELWLKKWPLMMNDRNSQNLTFLRMLSFILHLFCCVVFFRGRKRFVSEGDGGIIKV